MVHRVGLVACDLCLLSMSRFVEEMVTSTSTKWEKAFYIEMLKVFVFKYMNLGKLYLTYLSTVTVLNATFCAAMLKANGVAGPPTSSARAPKEGTQTHRSFSKAGRWSRQQGGWETATTKRARPCW